MKILGVGLGRTGTMSLTLALRRLGFRAMHYDRVRLNDVLHGSNTAPDFRRYDDVDAVLDVPSAYFYRELLDAYPEAKAILTVRDVEAWWKSIERHVNVHFPYLPPKTFGYDHRRRTLGDAPMTDPGAHNHFMMLLLNCALGLVHPPVGTVQFVGCAIGNISIGEATKTAWPYYLAIFVAINIVTYVPSFSTWLPTLINGHPVF